MVIYEWKDYQYLGKVTSETDDYLPVSIILCIYRDTLMSLVSRRRMYVPQMLCEVASVVDPVSVASFSTCRLENLLKTLRSGPQESRSQETKEALAMRLAKTFGTILQETPHLRRASILRPSAEPFKRVKLVSILTPVPPNFSYIMNRYSISFAKLGTTASVCLYTIREEAKIDNAVYQLSYLSQYCRPHHRRYRHGSPRIFTRHIKGPFCSEMPLMETSPRRIIRKSTYVIFVFVCPYCMTWFVVLLCHASLIHCIGGCLGLAVLQACYRNSSHTGKIHLSASAPRLTPHSTISPVLLASS
jgi:hypothetical protein